MTDKSPILVTGAAGFIGFNTCRKLLERGERIIGIDNLVPYYDVKLKQARLKMLLENKNFSFSQTDIADRDAMMEIATQHKPDRILHLAAQAGVRHAFSHPFDYSNANLIGQLVMLEVARSIKNLRHFVYASSSSVYGANADLPFSVKDRTDHPVSLYAATKKAGEVMSHSYSHLFGFPATGLRYFTVYGPWGRPDMALFLFTKAILAGEPITLFNNGDMQRNFTYIDDVVAGTIGCLDRPPSSAQAYGVKVNSNAKHAIYNIGNNKTVALMYFVRAIEAATGKKAEIKYDALQPGDVKETFADIDDTIKDIGFRPTIDVAEGIRNFVKWYREYYGV